MTPDQAELLRERCEGFDEFYESLLPGLVEFVGLLGISPKHDVLKRADEYVTLVERATQSFLVEDAESRFWFLTHMAYFVGEFFVQRFDGHWFVNDRPDTKSFARYVVGRFANGINPQVIVDPFEIAMTYVDSAPPRNLTTLLGDIQAALRKL